MMRRLIILSMFVYDCLIHLDSSRFLQSSVVVLDEILNDKVSKISQPFYSGLTPYDECVKKLSTVKLTYPSVYFTFRNDFMDSENGKTKEFLKTKTNLSKKLKKMKKKKERLTEPPD